MKLTGNIGDKNVDERLEENEAKHGTQVVNVSASLYFNLDLSTKVAVDAVKLRLYCITDNEKVNLAPQRTKRKIDVGIRVGSTS